MHEHALLVRASLADPVLDFALSHALLEAVAAGELPAVVRVARAPRALALSKLDLHAPRAEAAARIAVAAGFRPVVRLAGGRATALSEGVVELAVAVPDPDPRRRLHARFAEHAELIAAALRSLGVDAVRRELAGEWCPGAYSVAAGQRVKLAGLGQRIVSGAAYVGAVIVAEGAAALRDLLAPVYRVLGLPFDPATVGSVADELGSGEETAPAVATALVAAYGQRWSLSEAELDGTLLARARELAEQHLPPWERGRGELPSEAARTEVLGEPY